MTSLPWQLLQSFAAIVEHRSLSAAARALTVSQPTLSRHLGVLEETLGTRLFVRNSEGMEITPKGESYYAEVRKMADSAARLTRQDPDAPDEISGTVRLSASQITATYLLPDMLTNLRRTVPKLSIELVSSDATHNLLRREADIAVRMYRPTQSDIFVKKVAELELGIFAHKSYLDGKKEIRSEADLFGHDMIGYDQNTIIIDGMKALGLSVERDFFAFRSDDQVVCWQMVVAGFGIGFMQTKLGRNHPDLVQILPDFPIGSLPVWLAAHKELKSSPRVRTAFDHLAAAFAGLA